MFLITLIFAINSTCFYDLHRVFIQVTILLLLLVAFFFIGYLSAPKEERNENESESDTSKVKNDVRIFASAASGCMLIFVQNKPEVMSCEWMKECTRKR